MSALSRRDFLRSAACGAAALAAGCGESSGPPPNILFLLTDDQRWSALHAMGNPLIQTPNMDRLAAQGVMFKNNFVTTAICAVSRATFFTGLYARCHGIHGFDKPLSDEQHAISYPVRLREAGYRTGFLGKYGVGSADTIEASASHFDFWAGFPGQGQYVVEGRPHMTEHLGNKAVEFLDGCTKEQPWNLSISFKAPHVQDGVPPYFINDPKYDDLYSEDKLEEFRHMDGKYWASLPEFFHGTESELRFEQRFATPEKWQESVKRYYRLIYGVDVQIGRLLNELETRGMLDNTVILLTGDNGFYLGERRFAGKWYMHEESIRTPLIISDPRRPATHGTTRDEMTLNIDVAPTIQRLAGLDPAPGVQGVDLNPLVDGESPAWRDEWFYEHLFEHPRVPKSEGVRTKDWKYFQFTESSPLYEEMYDLTNDPYEYENLAASPEHVDQLVSLRERRQEWIANLNAWRIDQPWSPPAA